MSSTDEVAPTPDPRENRRWLVGIAISLLFGLFGAVMALLNYSDRAKPSVPGAGAAPHVPADRVEQGRRKERRRE